MAVRAYPRTLIALAGRVSPLLREMRRTEYQFSGPSVLDSSAVADELGLAPTPWDDVARTAAEDVPAATGTRV